MKKCLHCGTEMPDEERFCSECGAEAVLSEEKQKSVIEDVAVVSVVDPVNVEQVDVADPIEEVKLEEVLGGAEAEIKPVEPVPEKPAKKKMKWWHIAVPAVLVVAIVAVLLLGPFFIYLSPKTVLAKAFGQTMIDLSARVEGTPMTVMSKAYDETRKNTVKVEYIIFQEMLGEMCIEMDAKVDSSINQSQIGMQLSMMGQEVDMNLYMDREVAAVNMDMFTGDDYYGIYYDTFSQDIRENQFMFETIGEENVEVLEEAVDMVDQLMGLEAITPEQQAESLKKYGEVILAFAEEKDVQVGKAEASVDGKTKNCKTVAFTITKEEYAELMLQLIDVAETDPMMIYYYQSLSMDFQCEKWEEELDKFRAELEDFEDDGEECVFTFYLHGGKVVQVDVAYVEPDNEWLVSVNFSSDAAAEDIVISGEFVEDEDENSFEITLSTEKEDDVITETLHIVTQEDGDDPYELELGYEWDRKSGDLSLRFQEEEMSCELDCIFEELENGYRFSIPAVEGLIESMGEDTGGSEMSIDITRTTGAEIEVPETIKDIAKMTEMEMMSIASKIMDI